MWWRTRQQRSSSRGWSRGAKNNDGLGKLRVEQLEGREVPAFTATLANDGNVLFTGNASIDLLIVKADGQGELQHNRFVAGDAGFVSAFDFDSSQAGEQRFDNKVSTTRISVVDVGNNDTFRFDSTLFQSVTSKALDMSFGGDTTQGKLVLSKEKFDLINRNFAFAWDGSLKQVELVMSGPFNQGDVIDVNSAEFAQQTIVIDTGIGDDIVTIGGELKSLDRIVGTIVVQGGGGKVDLLTIEDIDSTRTGLTYEVSAGQTTRKGGGLSPLTIVHEEGDIEQFTLSTSNSSDTINLNSALIVLGDVVGMDIRSNGGADTINAKPDPFSQFAIAGGGPVSSPGDTLNIDITDTAVVTQGTAPTGFVTFTNRESIGFRDMEAVNVGLPPKFGIGYTAVTDANGNVLFTGSTSSDSLEISLDSNGVYRHNRFEEGDAGFESSSDFDSTKAGVQLFSTDGLRFLLEPEIIRVTDPGRNDALTFDLNQLLSSNFFNVTFAGTADTGTLNGFEVNGDNTFGIVWDETLAEIRYRGAGGGDGIEILRAGFAQQVIRIDSGFGDDSLTFGSGTTDAIASKIHFSGFVGNDVVFFADQEAIGGDRNYTITGNSTTRSKAGLPDAVLVHDVGDIESYIFLGSENADIINIESVIRLANGTSASKVEILGRGGADIFNATPDKVTPYVIEGDAPVVEPGDVINLNLAGTQLTSQAVPQAGTLTFAGRANIDFKEIESINQGTSGGPTGDIVLNGTTGNDVFIASRNGNQVIITQQTDAGPVNEVLNVAISDISSLTINGLEGNDRFDLRNIGTLAVKADGGEGNDILLGGLGDDTLIGGNGRDELRANGGNDIIRGDAGNDTLSGGVGNGSLSGGADFDTLVAFFAGGLNLNRTTLAGINLPVNQVLASDFEIAAIFTGDESELINAIAFGGQVIVESGLGDDTILGSAFSDVINAGGGNDVIAGLGGNDTVLAGDGQDRIEGNDGDDSLNAGTGNDTTSGGLGNDVIFLEQGDDSADLGAGNDVLFAGDGNDRAVGQSGDDTLHGDAGNDILQGNTGNDLITGNDGDDSLFGDEGDDTVDGGAGTDQANGGLGTNTLLNIP